MGTHKGESSQMKPPGDDIRSLEDEANIEKDPFPEAQQVKRQRVKRGDHDRPILQENQSRNERKRNAILRGLARVKTDTNLL